MEDSTIVSTKAGNVIHVIKGHGSMILKVVNTEKEQSRQSVGVLIMFDFLICILVFRLEGYCYIGSDYDLVFFHCVSVNTFIFPSSVAVGYAMCLLYTILGDDLVPLILTTGNK